MVEKFTKMLYELLVEKNIGLKEALEIISRKKSKDSNSIYNKKKLVKTGNFLLDEIMKGTALSNSMKRCPYMKFDDIYISFISFAEKTGDYKQTIAFLKNRCERYEESKYKLIEAGIYPTLVVLLAVGMVFYFSFTEIFAINREVFFYLGLLVLACILVFMGIKKIVGENKLYEAFIGIGFLLRAGINLYDAVGFGAQIVGVTTRKGVLFQQAREKLLLGMDVENAFCLGDKYTDAFYFANKSGGKNDVFEKLAKWIGDNDEKKRTICISVIEPLFILLTGIFLIILVVNIFMPYMANLSFINL